MNPFIRQNKTSLLPFLTEFAPWVVSWRNLSLSTKKKKKKEKMTPSLLGQEQLSSAVWSQRGGGQHWEKRCHRTVNVMYRHRHTVHPTMFLCSRKYFPPPNLGFLLRRKKIKLKKKQKHSSEVKFSGYSHWAKRESCFV